MASFFSANIKEMPWIFIQKIRQLPFMFTLFMKGSSFVCFLPPHRMTTLVLSLYEASLISSLITYFCRITAKGYQLSRPSLQIGRYTMIRIHHFQSHGADPNR